MKKADVKLGTTYVVRVSGHLAPVRLESESRFGGWDGRNLRTGRAVRIRSAAKLRREVRPAAVVDATKHSSPEGI